MELNEDLLKPQIVAAFDREFFEREGYWVWEGVLTEEGRARWTTSLQSNTGIFGSLLWRFGTDEIPATGLARLHA